MKEFELKYGCNPNQKPSKIYMADGSELPIEILSGRPGYINFLDAFNSWQLVKELKEALGLPAVTSFKHVSPTSAAVGTVLPEKLKKACFVDDIENLDASPLACAYARARGTDRMCSFGDWVALSDVCDVTTALLIKREVSDGVIAPGYEPEALEILKTKRNGNYNIVKIDPDFVPAEIETKQVYGITFEQGRNNFKINRELLSNIVTAAGVGALVISLGAQSVISDVIAGTFILFENQYRVGDYVQINNEYTGTVLSLAMRCTYLQTWKGEKIIIPNGQIKTVTNYSGEFNMAIVDIPTPYEEDSERILNIIKDIANKYYDEHLDICFEKPNVVAINSFDSSSITMTIYQKAKGRNHITIQRDLKLAVKKRFDQDGISIPYNQIVVHNVNEEEKPR